ncbi:hypothetical protein B5X24_HaOG216600 [Helicoverpa armigera]|nr:hypothetical protein B5X24_HaOG216600 [Helicoverpa armigera]
MLAMNLLSRLKAVNWLSLSPFVRHWQPAAYAHVGGHRLRRAALPPPEPPPPPLRLSFHAHNSSSKTFSLK